MTNLLALFLSLITFYFFSLLTFQQQSLASEADLLMEENSAFLATISANEYRKGNREIIASGMRYHHVLYLVENGAGSLVIYQHKQSEVDFLDEIDMKSKLGHFPEIPKKITVHDQDYLAVGSTNSVTVPRIGENSRTTDLFLVTLVPYEGLSWLNKGAILPFTALFLVLLLFSGSFIYYQGRKITFPIQELSLRTKAYAQRDFSLPLEVKTGDEVEELSHSIQQMVERLKESEQSDIILFRNLSHELKTPLTAISGYAEGMELGHFSDTAPPLRIIREESLRIRDLLEDLIFFSKLNNKTEEYHFQQVDLSQILIQSLEKVESIAILKEIDLDFTPSPPLYVHGDEGKLVRSFINILSNGLKHGKSTLSIQISTSETKITITVLDDGEGFSPEVLEKALKTTTDTTMDGSGLGLMIVAEILSVHGGSVKIFNRSEGGGGVITLFPRIKRNDDL